MNPVQRPVGIRGMISGRQCLIKAVSGGRSGVLVVAAFRGRTGAVERCGHPFKLQRALQVYGHDNPPVMGVPNSLSRPVGTDNHLAVASHSASIHILEQELSRLAGNPASATAAGRW